LTDENCIISSQAPPEKLGGLYVHLIKKNPKSFCFYNVKYMNKSYPFDGIQSRFDSSKLIILKQQVLDYITEKGYI
jgi:hypothetical protein